MNSHNGLEQAVSLGISFHLASGKEDNIDHTVYGKLLEHQKALPQMRSGADTDGHGSPSAEPGGSAHSGLAQGGTGPSASPSEVLVHVVLQFGYLFLCHRCPREQPPPLLLQVLLSVQEGNESAT